MRKKHYTLMTLALAGVMAFGGAGLLSLKISDAKTQESITTEKKNVDFADEALASEEKGEETKTAQNGKEIKLPKGAEIMEETGNSVKILWEGFNITYHTSNSLEENEADMGIERAIGGALKTIQKCTDQNLIGKNIEISLQKNVTRDDESISSKSGIIPLSSLANKRNYGVRYYAVDIDGTKGHSYSVCINSVTEEVFGYTDYYDKNSAGSHKEYDKEIPEQVKKEYTLIAKEFIKNNLEHLGTVKDAYALTGFMETEHSTRDTFDISCRTEKNDIVIITIDQEEKSVLCFEVNPIYID